MGFETIQERWHVIDGYENYAITESGKVYSINNYHNKLPIRKMALKGHHSSKRYISVDVCKHNKSTTLQVHRLVGKYFVDGYFEGAEIDHKDGNKHNNHYTNLEWVTHKENIHRSYSKVGPVRNFKLWRITDTNGNESPVLKGRGEILNYIQSNKLNIKISMLEKHKRHNGYVMHEFIQTTQTTSSLNVGVG